MGDRVPLITTIRRRLILLTVGLLLSGVLIGAYLLWDSYRISRAALDRQLMGTARALALVVDRELGQAAALTRALATSSHLASGDLRAFDRQAREVESGSSVWIVLFDEAGKHHVNTHIEAGAELPANAESARAIWAKLRDGETIVSNLVTGAAVGQPVIAVTAPVLIAGRLKYGLAYVMLPSVLRKVIADQRMPEGWIGNILDAEQNVVARSQGGDAVVGRKPSQPVRDAMARGDGGIVESISLEGRETIVAYSKSPLYRWSFAVSVPRAQVMQTITRNLALAALGGFGLLVLGALMAAWVARSISRPVESLTEVARAFGRGEPVEPLLTPIAEVNAVSRDMHAAAAELASRGADLRASESRLRLSVQATGIGIWDVDIPSGERTWSPELLSILGLPPDTQPDRDTFSRSIHPEDRNWVNERYRAFLRADGGEHYRAEFRIHHGQTREERWISVSGGLIRDADGRAVRASGTVMDVTDRRRVEDTLRESEERFRSMADSAPALIWLTDAQGGMVFINRYHEQFFGRPVDDLLLGDWADIIHPDDYASFMASFGEAMVSGHPWQRTVRVRDFQQSTRWLRCEGAPRYSGPDGEFLGYVGFNIDITESKLTADTLERRIEQRTGELAAANRQLIAQIEERERVEETLRLVQRLEAVGQLTSGVAHDFNNLLTVILGNISFAERDSAAKEGPLGKRLSNIRMAAERGASLVSQLLAFSRRQRLEPKIVNLNDSVGAMRELLQSSMGGSVAVEIVLDEELWPALVDPTQIELIILNLAINARDAMDVGGLLKVETSNIVLEREPRRPEEPAPGEYVCVSVSDSGSGMSDEVMARVFEPFFTTKDVGKGSGLGLSQVLGFAKQSGGGVHIATQVGKGTTVCVYVPRAAQSAGEMPRLKPPAAPRIAETPRILLVDDDDLVREVTASKLQEFGYTVIEAENGPEALVEIEKSGVIDLIILDFAMPGMNGVEVARAARKRRPAVPLAFLTGYADLTALGEFAGEPILHKPFRDAELGKLVSGLLRGAKTGEAAQADNM